MLWCNMVFLNKFLKVMLAITHLFSSCNQMFLHYVYILFVISIPFQMGLQLLKLLNQDI
jgi:hypothetical protein